MGMSKEEITIQCFIDPSNLKLTLNTNLSASLCNVNEALAALVELDPRLHDVIERKTKQIASFG